jgi:signal transduction histidine kinase
MVGQGRQWYHKLRSELRSSEYRLLRARNQRVASWLMERVKVGLVVVVPDGIEMSGEFAEESTLDYAPHEFDATTDSGIRRPTLLIRRDQQTGPAECGTVLQNSPDTDCWEGEQTEVLQRACTAWIPTLFIIPTHGPRPEKTLVEAVAQGADYVLFAPYDQNELLQAIRTAILNGRTPHGQEDESYPLDIHLQDRMSSLDASREQLARLFAGTVEQLAQARATVSWCESEIRALRQARVQQELVTQSQTHGLPEVVQGVAHDFANLLEAAGSAATALYAQPHSAAMYRDAMRGVMDQAQELIEALTELTATGRENWRTEPVELDGLVSKALLSALVPLRDPQIRVRVRIGGLEPVWAHRSLVYRALLNLIWNAVQAMPSGGMLSVLGYVRGNRVVLEVGDTGVGIAAKDRNRVLQQRFSTKPGHRGMGLTLVRELIEKCGGEITYTSRPQHGSLFSIALPVVKATGVGKTLPAVERAQPVPVHVLTPDPTREPSSRLSKSGLPMPPNQEQPLRSPVVLQP